ncbi:MAG: SpoVR family protein [Parcubacteria group bacterium GW2011_GWA2_38_13b]|nr:MAG: SpoVR family protein [Parcubacteria group bacterium GW2011_GWA2_38_13b]
MHIISQHTKKIMEECKIKAREAGLKFDDGTLEYIVTNNDLVELQPKFMIPTMYDYWVHDVGIMKGSRIYEVYPNNPYETVINTRPAISFYNDNNPDWMNMFIFYHVLAHIDFLQNNVFFQKTWDYDFCGRAISDKRSIIKLREDLGEKKRWVDYAIEFSRSIDNTTNYYQDLNNVTNSSNSFAQRFNFYFDIFLDKFAKEKSTEYLNEIERYNKLSAEFGENKAENIFLETIENKYKSFNENFKNFSKEKTKQNLDIMQYIAKYSESLNKPANQWMKQIIEIIRHTSLFFAPQIKTKMSNEGWASYWHEKLFLNDRGIRGHEIDFASTNARITAMRRVGLNPYGLGKKLLEFAEDLASKGKLNYEFQKMKNAIEREDYDKKTNDGQKFIFYLRKYFDDFQLLKFWDAGNFQDFVTKNKLFVTGKKLNLKKQVWEYYVKSRKGEDYRQMVIDSLYHPPYVVVGEKTKENELYLDHKFEGKQLVAKYIPDVMRGINYFWGGPVKLETTIFDIHKDELINMYVNPDYKPKYKEQRVLYELDDYKKNPNVKNL